MPFDPTPQLSPEDIAINEALDRLLEALGSAGLNWCSDGPGNGFSMCVVVALDRIGKSCSSATSMALYDVARQRGFASIPAFNDHPDTHWPDVVALIAEARR